MPRGKLPPLSAVPLSEAELIEQETLIRAAARKKSISRSFDETLGSTAEEAEYALYQMREDIGKFGEYVFGWKPEPFHAFWNQAADDVIQRRIPQNKLLIIAPPNSAKSSWNSIVRPAHYLGQHPDHNIVFLTSSDPMASTFGSTIRTTLEFDLKYRSIFPNPENRPHRARGWSTDGLYLRGTPPGSKDPAYKAVGFNATIMGARAHGMILDDPLDQKNATSETEQRRAKTYYDQTLVPRLQPDTGWMLGVMTRFHENDFASHLIRLAEEAEDWIVIRTPQVAEESGDPLGRAPGELLWPSRFSADWVARERRRMGVGEFNLVHQGDPTGIGGDVFREEGWFQSLPPNFWAQIFPKCHIISGWDLAFSENKRACFTVGITAAIDKDFNLYILNIVRKRMTLGDTEDTLVKLIQMTKPLILGIEESRFHQQLTRSMARRVMSRVMCNIQLVRPDSDKTSRALLPAARAEAGKLFVNKDTVWYPHFVQECLGFPNTKYKDQVDALSLVAYLVERLAEYKSTDRVIQTETVMA